MKLNRGIIKRGLALICALLLFVSLIPLPCFAATSIYQSLLDKAEENLANYKTELADRQRILDDYKAQLPPLEAELADLKERLADASKSLEEDEYLQEVSRKTNGLSDTYLKLYDAMVEANSTSFNLRALNDEIAQKQSAAKSALDTLVAEESKRIGQLDANHDDIIEFLNEIGATQAAAFYDQNASVSGIGSGSQAGKLSNWFTAINYMANINTTLSSISHYPISTNYTDMVRAQLESAYASTHAAQMSTGLVNANQYVSIYQGTANPYDIWYKEQFSRQLDGQSKSSEFEEFGRLVEGSADGLAVGVVPNGSGSCVSQILNNAKPLDPYYDTYYEGIDLKKSRLYGLIKDVDPNNNPNLGNFNPPNNLLGTGVSYNSLKIWITDGFSSVDVCEGCGRAYSADSNFCIYKHSNPTRTPNSASTKDHEYYPIAYHYSTHSDPLGYWMDYGRYTTNGASTVGTGIDGTIPVDTMASQLYGYLDKYAPASQSYRNAVAAYQTASNELSDVVMRQQTERDKYCCNQFDRQHLKYMIQVDALGYGSELRASGYDPEELYMRYAGYDRQALQSDYNACQEKINDLNSKIEYAQDRVDDMNSLIKDTQEKIDEYKQAIENDGQGENAPEIQSLIDSIETAKQLLASTAISDDGKDVSKDRYWTKAYERYVLENAVKDGERTRDSYLFDNAETLEHIVQWDSYIKEKTADFRTSLKPGLMGEDTKEKKFSDVDPDAWYVIDGSLQRAVDLGLMRGYNDSDKFGIGDSLKREECAKVLYNLFGDNQSVSPSATYSDVPLGAWYSDPVYWCHDCALMNGYGNGTIFGLGDPLTREQFALVLARAAQRMQGVDYMTSDLSVLYSYSDSQEVTNTESQHAFAWAISNGIIGGVNGVFLAPNQPATREQAAAMFVRAIDGNAHLFKDYIHE